MRSAVCTLKMSITLPQLPSDRGHVHVHIHGRTLKGEAVRGVQVLEDHRPSRPSPKSISTGEMTLKTMMMQLKLRPGALLRVKRGGLLRMLSPLPLKTEGDLPREVVALVTLGAEVDRGM